MPSGNPPQHKFTAKCTLLSSSLHSLVFLCSVARMVLERIILCKELMKIFLYVHVASGVIQACTVLTAVIDVKTACVHQ